MIDVFKHVKLLGICQSDTRKHTFYNVKNKKLWRYRQAYKISTSFFFNLFNNLKWNSQMPKAAEKKILPHPICNYCWESLWQYLHVVDIIKSNQNIDLVHWLFNINRSINLLPCKVKR